MKHYTYCIFLLLLTLANLQTDCATTRETAKNLPANTPLCFIENKGQITDQYGKTRKDIDFKLKANGLNVFIGDGAIHYQWIESPLPTSPPGGRGNISPFLGGVRGGIASLPGRGAGEASYRMDVVLLGANKTAVPVENETNDYYENYYTEPIGLKGATAHSFKRITYKNVYPNIDWVLYISNGALKYDFVVHPGGDVKTIRLQYNGATGLELKNGALIAVTPMGSITEQAPYTYYAKTKETITSNYILNGNILSYNIVAFLGTAGDVIIDPILDWATYYGGSDYDNYFDITNDGTNIFLSGTTRSTTSIATTGAYQTVITGTQEDAVISCFNEGGNLLWATYYGGSDWEWECHIAYDHFGSIYIAGTTASTSNIASAGSHQSTYGGGGTSYGDNFLAKFTTAGSFLWGTYYGGSGNEYIATVACNNTGDVFLGGNTFSTNNIATSGSYQPSKASGEDIYIAKFNPSGGRLWATFYGGANDEEVEDIDCDNAGNVVLIGKTRSSGMASTGALQSSFSGVSASLILKFTTNGNRLWASYYSGNLMDEGYAVKCDTQGHIYIAGRTRSTTGIATSGAHQTAFASTSPLAWDGYIAKLDSNGTSRLWSTYFGGNNDDIVRAIDIHRNGYIYIAGWTSSPSGISTANAFRPTISGSTDNILIEMRSDGFIPHVTYFGGTSDENENVGVSCLRNSVYLSSCSNSLAGLSTPGSYQSQKAGNYDIYLARFSTDTVPIVRQTFNDTALCIGDTIYVPVDVSYKFKSNNIFTVQLSGANSNWISPLNIGTLAADTACTVMCIIPAGVSPGYGYRIRILSSAPQDTSKDNQKNIGMGGAVPTNLLVTSDVPACAAIPLHLFASASGTVTSYKWTGPGNYTSSVANPMLTNPTFSNSGRYHVIAYWYGCSTKDSIDVNILPSASPLLATANSPVCINDTLKLDPGSTPAGCSFNWTGPNGFTSTQSHPAIGNVSILANGNYILAANLNGCVTADTVFVNIVTPSFTLSATSNSPVCDQGNFTLDVGTPTSGVTYSWNGPLGFTTSGHAAGLSNVAAVNAGNYIVTATSGVCTLKDTVTLVVNPLPVKPVAASNTPICTTDTLRLNAATTTTGIGYSWTGPNGFTSPVQNPSVNNPPVAAAGDYIVMATITATGCSAKDTETVTITQSPSVTATNNSPVCEGSTVSLSAAASPVTAVYSWSGPGSFSSPSQNPVISNAATTASGDYIVSATLNGCTGKDTTTVLVKPNPIMPVTNSNTPVCIGGALNLTAASNAGSTYSWTGPNSFSSILQNPSKAGITAADAGIYSVIATLNGCTSAAGTTTVVVNPQPFVTIYATPADSICQGSTATFVALPANASASVAYKWTKNSSPAVLGTANTFITTTLNNNDILRCEITETQKCGMPFTDTSNEVKMTVLPWVAPSVSISANPATPLSPYQLVSFAAVPVNGGGSPQYQWTRNGSNVIGASTAGWSTQQLSNNDVICVTMTSSEKCPQPKTVQSNCIKVTVLTGVDNVADKANLQLYPNPNDGRFILHAENIHAKEVQLEIVNGLGQLVHRQKAAIHNSTLHENIDIRALAGAYLLKLEAEGKTYTLRFTIDR